MLLDPQTLSKLDSMHLRARRVVEGALSGLHKSPHHGQSVEFAEHKEYTPGDEIRHIDWKAYAKFDKYYVKRFEHETNLRATIALDASGSMAYASEGVTKLQYATYLAAALAYLLARQQDAVGLAVLGAGAGFAPGVRSWVPARASATHLSAVLGALEEVRGEGPTDLVAAADFLSEKVKRRSMVILISDLFDPDPRAIARLRRLRARRNEVIVFHLLDRDELEFPFDDPTEFKSMEDERQIEAHPRSIKESYLEEIGLFLAETQKSLREADIDYVRLQTDTQLDKALVRFLARRERA